MNYLYGQFGGVKAAVDVLHEELLDLCGNMQLSAYHDSGDILCPVGYFVLLVNQVQKIGSGQRHEQRIGEIKTDFAFQEIRFLFLGADFLLTGQGFLPVVRKNAFKKFRKILAAFMNLLDMVIHRFKRGFGKQA